MSRNNYCCSINIYYWFNTGSISRFKKFLAIIAPIMIGLGAASRTLNKEDEEDNKCRNCGHELDGDDNFCPICGTKRI